eukprot:2939899-Pyramimonas_sp.AAC.1
MEATRFHRSRVWEWLDCASPDVRAAFPPTYCRDDGKHFWGTPPVDTTASVDDALGFAPPPLGPSDSRLRVSLKVCQFNCKSASEKEVYGQAGRRRLARNLLTSQQMGEAGVHLVGLQESWNAKGVRRVGDFFAAASGFSDE